MNVIPVNNKNQVISDWVTINEAVNIINRHGGVNITDSTLLRYALNGHLSISIYFQSPVVLRRVKTVKNKLLLIKAEADPVSRLCYLSRECYLKNDHWIVKTEGDNIALPCHVMDTPLLGCEYAELQKSLAVSLKLPLPEKGFHNIHCGLLVCDEKDIYHIYEYSSLEQRITQQLQGIPEEKNDYYHNGVYLTDFDRQHRDYFPVYHFPADACFVVKQSQLRQFISTHLAVSTTTSSKVSTPVARFLWLACKHNDAIKDMTGTPYKLVSVFEQWAIADGITDHLSGDTLKKALKRGAPV